MSVTALAVLLQVRLHNHSLIMSNEEDIAMREIDEAQIPSTKRKGKGKETASDYTYDENLPW